MRDDPDPSRAWEQLTDTGPGEHVIELLIKLTLQIGRGNSFPPPPQHATWNRAAAMDVLAAIFAKKSDEFVLAARATASDQQSLERVLLRTIRNWLIDEAKATPIGRMRRRLMTLLAADSRFRRADPLLAGEHAWTRPEFGDVVWQGDTGALFEASASHATEPLTNLNPAGPTSAQNKRIILDYLLGVLLVAAGALRAQVLATFVVNRFGLRLEQEPFGDDVIAASDPTPDATFEILAISDAIMAQLNGRDELVLAYHQDVNGLAGRLGISGPEAERAIREVMDRIRPYCQRTETGTAAMRIVLEICSIRQ